jgi:predicted enzyme related to lactoylglutathione lyase
VSGFIVNVDVDDLARAIAFYTLAFELRVGRTFGAGQAGVELIGSSLTTGTTGTSVPMYFLVKAAGTQPAPGSVSARDYARHWTPVHLDFIVDDIRAAVARVEAAGATRESEIETHGYGLFAQYADPFGNGFCLIQFIGGGYDAIADKKR